jgi:hypothetical protein
MVGGALEYGVSPCREISFSELNWRRLMLGQHIPLAALLPAS